MLSLKTLHPENCYSRSGVCLLVGSCVTPNDVTQWQNDHFFQTAKLDKIFNAPLDHHVIILLNGKIALLIPDKVINDK